MIELNADESMLILITKDWGHKDVPFDDLRPGSIEYIRKVCNKRCGLPEGCDANVFQIYSTLAEKYLSVKEILDAYTSYTSFYSKMNKHDTILQSILSPLRNLLIEGKYELDYSEVSISERFKTSTQTIGQKCCNDNDFLTKQLAEICSIHINKIEDWSIIIKDPYKSPEQQKAYLSGQVYNNPKFQDGTIITTSSIINKKGNIVITRSGSYYELGKVSLEYEQLYPNAKERLLNSLKEVD